MLAKNVCVWGKTIPLKYNSCNLSDWDISYLIALTWPYVGTILSSVKVKQISQRRPSNNQSYF